MAETAAAAALYGRLVGARLRSDWQYRTSFWLFLLSQTVSAGFDLVVILVLFGHIEALAGWSVEEVALLYGVTGLAFGVADVFVSQVEFASRRIKAGTFDLLLIRPLGTLVQLSAYEFAFRRVGRVLQPVALLVVALLSVDVDWSFAKVALLPVSVVAGAVIFGAIWVITSSLSFWTVETQEVASAFTYGGNLVSHYPFDVLGPWLRRLATFLVPIAFVGFLPVAYITGHADPLGLPGWVAFASPAVAILSALLARGTWRLALRHYRSTGS